MVDILVVEKVRFEMDVSGLNIKLKLRFLKGLFKEGRSGDFLPIRLEETAIARKICSF